MKLLMKTSSLSGLMAFLSRRESFTAQSNARFFFTKLTICYVAQFPSPTGCE
jgi:hypothetical protein